MSKQCLVIEHLAVEHAGTFRKPLLDNGYELASVPAAAISSSRDQAKSADLLVVMGGPIGVYDAPEYPFLTEEIDIIRDRLQRQAPVLGVCLGSQLMAAALGAKVYPGKAGFELGWAPVQLTEDGRLHSIAHLVNNQNAPVLHWHGDTFDLPKQASLLAFTDRYRNQAFAVGNFGLALQFHVETDEAELEQWFVAFAGDIRSFGSETLAKLRADSQKYCKELEQRNNRFMSDWISKL